MYQGFAAHLANELYPLLSPKERVLVVDRIEAEARDFVTEWFSERLGAEHFPVFAALISAGDARADGYLRSLGFNFDGEVDSALAAYAQGQRAVANGEPLMPTAGAPWPPISPAEAGAVPTRPVLRSSLGRRPRS